MTHRFEPMILPVPHLRQPALGECLPTCVTMVMVYLGMRVNYHQLLRLLHTQQGFGTSFSNVRYLSQLGMMVLYEKGTLSTLQRWIAARRPVLVPVQTGELPYWGEDTPHAVVVVGMDAHSVYLNDPAFAYAPIRVSQGDFILAWLEHDEYYAVLSP